MGVARPPAQKKGENLHIDHNSGSPPDEIQPPIPHQGIMKRTEQFILSLRSHWS